MREGSIRPSGRGNPPFFFNNVSKGVKSFSFFSSETVRKQEGKYRPFSHPHVCVIQSIGIARNFNSTPWHSICFVPRHELLPRISNRSRAKRSFSAPGADPSAKLPRHARTVDMKTFTVYRYDYIRQMREPVGKLTERRRKERGNNAADLLKLAQILYSTMSLDSHVAITPE
jgi:hypothetical protein